MKKLLAIALGLLLAGPAVAQDKITLRVGTVAPEGTPWYKIVRRMKRRIEKDSGGRIKVKVFAGQMLGGEKSLVRRCQSGTLEMIGVSAGAMASAVPEMNAYELPYLIDDFRQADKVLDATFGTAKGLLAAKGFELYIWSENGFRDFATKDGFVKTPTSLSGVKMRSQESFVHTEMYKLLGAKPNVIAVPNVPESLANGVVSGYDNTLLYAYAAEWYPTVKYITLTHHIYQPAVIAFNKKWFDALPADLKPIVKADAEKETKNGRFRIRAMNVKLQGMYEQKGITFHKPSADERAKMKAATRPVYDAFRQRTGATGSSLLDEILKAKK